MKKKVLSLLFACIMLLSVLAIAGCKSDELQAQIDENATKAETAVTDAAAKAAKDLADAKAELEALIAAGDQADVKALNDAVAKLNTAIEAAKTAATAADDALKTELTAAIAAAKKEATDAAAKALDEAVKKLNADVALKVDATAYEKAVADLQTSVANAKTAATEADAKVTEALEAKIAAAQTAAIEDAKKYVDSKVEELKGLQTADKTELAAAIQEVKDAAAAADAAAKKAFADATAADTTLEGKLNDKLAALEEAIKGANTSADNAWGEWNEATEIVIKNLAELKKAEKTFEGSKYYALLSDTIKNKAIEIIAETEARLLRSVDKAAAEAEYKYADNFFAAIDGIYKVYESYSVEKKAYYYEEQLEEMKVALGKAMDAIKAATKDTDIPAIQTAFEADLDAVHNKAEALTAMLKADGTPVKAVILNEKWVKLLADVDYKLNNEDEKIAEELKFSDVEALYDEYKARYDMLEMLKAEAALYNENHKKLAEQLSEENKDKGYFNKDSVELYKAYELKVEEWYKNLGDTNEENKKMLDTAILEEMIANYEARKKGHEDYAAKLLSDLKVFGAEKYVYLYSEELEEEVFALYENYIAFKGYVVKIGYELGEEYHVAFNAFEKGTYTRALAMNKAAAEAVKINGAIAELDLILKNLTTFKTEYQDKMIAIDSAVAAWKKAYFADPYAAEAVAGNVNYELVKHDAYAALQALYAEKLGAIVEAMNRVVETFNADGFRTINLLSKNEIDDAKEAWAALIKLVGDLGLDTEEIVVGHITDLGEKATTTDVANLLYKKDLEYQARCEEAYKEYKVIEDALPAANKVTIYDEKIVTIMVDWYKKYMGIDPSDDASVLPEEGKNLKLSETVTITDDLYAAAKATYTAWEIMTGDKKDEMDTLNKDIADFLASTVINTESRDAYDALMARYEAFITGKNVPAPYATEQYKVNELTKEPYFVDISKLVEAGKKIEALEKRRNDLFKALDALAGKTFADALLNVDPANVAALNEFIDTVEAEMIVFTLDNAGFNCFVASEDGKYTNRAVIIAQSREIMEIAAIYDRAIKNVGAITPEDVKKDLTDRATAARTAALKLIRELDPEAWETSAAYAIEKAKLEVVEKTIAAYIEYAPEKGDALMTSCYWNSVVHHIDGNVTVEALAKFENRGEGVEELIKEASSAVTAFFKAIEK